MINGKKDTIEHIQQIAIHTRRTLIHVLDQHVLEVKQTLEKLTSKLYEARHFIKSFNENDIKQWARILQELKQMPEIHVIIDKNNPIYGLTIDFIKNTHTHCFESNREDSISHRLVSTPTSIPNITENQIIHTDLPKTNHRMSQTEKLSLVENKQ